MIKHNVYQFGAFRFDSAERVIESNGRRLSVTPKALDVLIVLIENRGHIVEKEDLIKKVWPDTFVEDSNLVFNIFVLRKLFGDSGASPRYIETVSRRGYRFIADVVACPLGVFSGEVPLQNEQAYRKLRPADLHGTESPATHGNPDDAGLSATPLLRAARGFSRTHAFLITFSIVAVVGFLIYYLRRAEKLTETDTIVLADFVNKTGDPVFDGTLRQGLVVQLEQSPFLNLLSEQRIHGLLPLMGQPADARQKRGPTETRGIPDRPVLVSEAQAPERSAPVG